MNTWTLYTFGDGDLIAAILQAVALLVSGAMGSLLRAVAIGGLGLTLSMAAVGALAWTRAMSWLVGFLVVFTGLIQIAVPVAVEDVADTRIPPQVVQNVPLLVAMPAALSSELAYRTTLLATSLQLNGELGSGQTFLAPSINVQLLLSANLQPGDLRANIVNYVNYCVAPPNSKLVNPPGVIPHSPDLFAKLESQDEAIMVPTVANGQIVGSLTCRQHYLTVLTPVLAPLAPAADLGLSKTIEDLKCQIAGGRRIVGGPASCIDDATFWDLLNSSLQALSLGASATADQVLVTAMLAKLLPEGEMDYAKRIMDEPAAIQIANDGLIKQLEIQSKAGADSVKSGLVRQIRAMADGTVLLGAPVLLALSVTPLVWTFLGIYVRLFAWLGLWGPIQAVTHFVALTMAASDVGGLAGVNGITAANLHEVFLHLVQTNAIGYDMLLAVPGVALAMAWGGVGALSGALQGAGAGVLRTSQESWRRTESGESVLASSLTKGQVLAETLRRPPNDTAFTTPALQAAWSGGVAMRSQQGSTVMTPDGQTITTMRDGSSHIKSPTKDLSVTPGGFKTGSETLTSPVTVSMGNGRSFTVGPGTHVRYLGTSAEVNLSSRRDPLTEQTVVPVGRFAQDPNAPGGFGALQSKDWTVAYKGFTYQATEDANGQITYRSSGTADLNVPDSNGQTVPRVAQVEMTQTWQPDGQGKYKPVESAIGTARYKDEKGNWHHEQGTFKQENGQWQFTPFTGDASNKLETKRTDKISIATPDGKTVTGTMIVETSTNSVDGTSATRANVVLDNGLTYEIFAAGGITTATVSGMLHGVELKGGGAPPGAKVDLPLNHVPVMLKLPDKLQQLDGNTLSQAIRTGHVQPFTAHVVNHENPGAVAELQVSNLNPFGSLEGTREDAVFDPLGWAQDGSGVKERTPPSGPTAFVGKYESSTTGGEVLGPGTTHMPGNFVVWGELKQEGDKKSGRHVIVGHLSPTKQLQILGAGEVVAQRNPQTGQWEVVSLNVEQGKTISNNDSVSRNEGVYRINPQTMALAASGDKERLAAVARDLVNTTNAQRQTREMEQASAMARWYEQQLTKQGEESGQGTARVKFDPSKLIRKFRKLNAFGVEVGGLLGSSEQETYNLWVSAVRGAQQAAHGEAVVAANQAPPGHFQQVYDRVFAEKYGEKLQAIKRIFDEAVKGDSEGKHGNDALINRAPGAAMNMVDNAARGANNVMTGAVQGANQLTGNSGSDTPQSQPAQPNSLSSSQASHESNESSPQAGSPTTGGAPTPQSASQAGTDRREASAVSQKEKERIITALTANEGVRNLLAHNQSLFLAGHISEEDFKQSVLTAIISTYVGLPGSKPKAEYDRAMETARRATDEIVDEVKRSNKWQSPTPGSQSRSSSPAAPSVQPPPGGKPNPNANDASRPPANPASPGSNRNSAQRNGATASQPGVPPTGTPTERTATQSNSQNDRPSGAEAASAANESETEPPVEILQQQTQEGIEQAEQAIKQLNEMDSQAATPASPPVQDKSAKPAGQESPRDRQTPPSATAGSPSGNGSAATPSTRAESGERPEARESRSIEKGQPPRSENAVGPNRLEAKQDRQNIYEDQSDKNFVAIRQVMEDLAVNKILYRDVPPRVYDIYRAQGVDLQGKVLVVGNWRFDFSEYRRK